MTSGWRSRSGGTDRSRVVVSPSSAACTSARSGPREWDQGANWNGAVAVVVDGGGDEEAETDDRCGAPAVVRRIGSTPPPPPPPCRYRAMFSLLNMRDIPVQRSEACGASAQLL